MGIHSVLFYELKVYILVSRRHIPANECELRFFIQPEVDCKELILGGLSPTSNARRGGGWPCRVDYFIVHFNQATLVFFFRGSGKLFDDAIIIIDT